MTSHGAMGAGFRIGETLRQLKCLRGKPSPRVTSGCRQSPKRTSKELCEVLVVGFVSGVIGQRLRVVFGKKYTSIARWFRATARWHWRAPLRPPITRTIIGYPM